MCRIIENYCASVESDGDVIFIIAAMGISIEVLRKYKTALEEIGKLQNSLFFIVTPSDSPFLALRLPNVALTAAEYFAKEKQCNVVVISMGYDAHLYACQSLDNVRNKFMPKGAPYWYRSEVAKIFERSGRWRGSKGTVTHLPIVTMANDDVTHVIPETFGSLADGVIYLSRELHNKGIFPPVDVLLSYSKFVTPGILALVEETWRRLVRANEVEKQFLLEDTYKALKDFKIENQFQLDDEDEDENENEYKNDTNVESNLVLDGEDEKRYLKFKEQFLAKFISQAFTSRTVKTSVEILQNLLRNRPFT